MSSRRSLRSSGAPPSPVVTLRTSPRKRSGRPARSRSAGCLGEAAATNNRTPVKKAAPGSAKKGDPAAGASTPTSSRRRPPASHSLFATPASVKSFGPAGFYSPHASLAKVLATPGRGAPSSGIFPSLSSSSADQPDRYYRRACNRQVPPQFRPMLPTSARKKPESPAKTSPVVGMAGGSFYGGGTAKSAEIPRQRRESVASQPDDEPGTSRLSSEALKKSEDSTGRAKKSKMVRKRSRSSFGSAGKRNPNKRRKVLTGGLGLNRGVSHGIKRPKAKKKPPPGKENKDKEPPVPKPAKPVPPKKLFQVTPGSVGALTPTVNYVIKNGQFQFIRRRSPRKKNREREEEEERGGVVASPSATLAGSASTPVARMTPKLFTPSGKGDFLRPPSSAENSPSGRKKRFIPSPVKFAPVPPASAHEEDSNHADGDLVSSIIDTLGGGDEPGTGEAQEIGDTPVKGKEDDYAVYVNDEEQAVSQAAWDAVQDLQGLQELDYGGVGDDDSPLALANPGSSEGDRMELAISEGESSELDSAGNDPASGGEGTQAAATTGGAKRGLFAVFQKGAKTGISNSPKSSEQQRGPAAGGVTAASLREARDGMQQMIIDAGQKKIGSQQCSTCRFFYTPGDAQEERLHQKEHNRILGVVDFSGWKKERVVQDDGLFRVVVILPGDPKRHREKAQAVLGIVDEFLGVGAAGGSDTVAALRQPDRSDVYLAVTEGRVAGCLLAEPLRATDRVSRSSLHRGVRVLHDLPGRRPHSDFAGVSRLWVHEDFQRRGVATRLMEAMRMHHCKPFVLEKSKIALSHTSEMGSLFAASYFGSPDFTVYRPESL